MIVNIFLKTSQVVHHLLSSVTEWSIKKVQVLFKSNHKLRMWILKHPGQGETNIQIPNITVKGKKTSQLIIYRKRLKNLSDRDLTVPETDVLAKWKHFCHSSAAAASKQRLNRMKVSFSAPLPL